MITQIITDQIGDIKLDTMTIAGLLFAVFLVIHFFVSIKPAIDSKRRINRQAARRYENYLAATQARQKIADYNKKNPNNRKPNYQKNQSLKKDKGYQAYLRRNAPKYMAVQDKQHAAYIKLVKNKPIVKSGGRGKFPSNAGFIGDIPLNRKPIMPRYLGPTNSFLSK